MNESPAEPSSSTADPAPGRRPPWFWAAVPAVLVGAVAFLLYARYAGSRESTDDAFLDADIVAVAPSVAGKVAAVGAEDNEEVKRGALLVQIDPKSYAAGLAERAAAAASAAASVPTASAQLAEARAHLLVLEAAESEARADADAARAEADRAAADLQRGRNLIRTAAITPQEFDRAAAAAAVAAADYQAALKKIAGAAAGVEEGRLGIESAAAGLEAARDAAAQAAAARRFAAIDFADTRILAPIDGRVTRKAVDPGDYVDVGQSLLALVSSDFWVTANFKENQLAHMRPGQPVEVGVDADPGRVYRAHVDSIQTGSGARFSLFPPENATGNYVKVVQRVPVKIVFDELLDPGVTLGPGESVAPTVITGWRRLSLFTLASVGVVTLVVLSGLWWLTRPKAAA